MIRHRRPKKSLLITQTQNRNKMDAFLNVYYQAGKSYMNVNEYMGHISRFSFFNSGTKYDTDLEQDIDTVDVFFDKERIVAAEPINNIQWFDVNTGDYNLLNNWIDALFFMITQFT